MQHEPKGLEKEGVTLQVQYVSFHWSKPARALQVELVEQVPDAPNDGPWQPWSDAVFAINCVCDAF